MFVTNPAIRRCSLSGLAKLTSFRRGASVLAASLLGMALLAGATASAAQAASLPKNLAKFADCPVRVKRVSLCLFSKTTSTTFQIGSTIVTSTKPTTLSIGLEFTSSGAAVAVLPDNGTQALQSPALPLPGGLTGIPGLGGGLLAVTATPQLVGAPSINFGSLLTGRGAGLTLPIDVLVSTPSGLLGPACTIGDERDPVTLTMTTGTTNPPPPNTPISGSTGTLKSTSEGLLSISGMKLVDNAFAVPGADNCGLFGALDPVLDLDKQLPSAAGLNTAILAGSAYTAPASLIAKYLG